MSLQLAHRLLMISKVQFDVSYRPFSTGLSLGSTKNPRNRPKTLLDIPKYLRPMFDGKLEYEYPNGLHGTGERPVGVKLPSKEFVRVPEMIPELVVPDLKDFPLKAYVSFKAPNVVEPELTARDVFDVVYGKKIQEAFDKGLLDEEVAQVEERAKNGQLRRHSYDLDPPRMLDSSKVPVT